MPRPARDAAPDARQAAPRGAQGATAHLAASTTQLGPAKQRVAEALAALLVAHYRRQHEQVDPEDRQVPPAQ